MDNSDGYQDLDLALAEPGLIEDTRIADAAAAERADSCDEAMLEAFAGFDRGRALNQPAATCLIRFQAPVDDALTARVASSRILQRMQGAIRSPDVCLVTDRGDYALALAGCDVATARKRVGLMVRLVQMDPLFVSGLDVWTGIAPVTSGNSAHSLRTAVLACDLAAFQPPGHIEVIEL